MIPASLRRPLDQRTAEVTTIWRNGDVLRDGKELPPIDPLPFSFPATPDDPFPHD